MLTSTAAVSGIQGTALPARLGRRPSRWVQPAKLVCRVEKKQAIMKRTTTAERTDTPRTLAIPVAAAALAGLLLSSAVVPDEAFAARSSGRVGGSSFRSAAPSVSSGSAFRSSVPRAAPPRTSTSRVSVPRPSVPQLSKPLRPSVPRASRVPTPKTTSRVPLPKATSRVSTPKAKSKSKPKSLRSSRALVPKTPAPGRSVPGMPQFLRSSHPQVPSGRGGRGGGVAAGGNSYRGGNTYNSYTVAPSIGGYGGGYYPGGFGGGITLFPSFYSPPVFGLALPLGVMFNLTFTLLVVGAVFAVIKSAFGAVTGGGSKKRDEWD